MARIDRRLEKLERQLASVESPAEKLKKELSHRILKSFSTIELDVAIEVYGVFIENPDLSNAEIDRIMSDAQRSWPPYFLDRHKKIIKEILDERPDLRPHERGPLLKFLDSKLTPFEFCRQNALKEPSGR